MKDLRPALSLHALVEREAARLDAAQLSYGQGTANAYDEAAWLVQWALGLPMEALGEAPAQGVSPDNAARAAALIDRRIATREPAAYLTGEAWLQGLPFTVDRRVIIPRSFIAELIADADGQGLLDAWLSERTQRVLDLCTGNGSLAVLAALAWPEVQVDAADLSADALAVARLNVDRHGLRDRITLLHGDGLAATADRAPYDLIVCNPPYVNAASMAALPPEFRAEPALALDGNPAGGQDGMDFIRALLAAAAAHMSEHAVLVLEIGHERAHFEAAFPRLEPIWLEVSAGEEQVLLLRRGDLAGVEVCP
ncbi:50S ribosomal protein L3 N(5)-glutamine methyltransferase [Aquariibacter lacus]|uniref:50S ribosomal protein L3 N(5)-glutamine methyltransferase n=1 Tax=Aquariibacter lacus TaxID=2801332 RepID=UPI002572ADD0|nr:50S ribosomal protein L3 N(5)-glutamine methyltransferase [Piscinibacter lacus]